MRRIILAMTGASGSIYAIRLLELLRAEPAIETHLLISRSAGVTLRLECPEWSLDRVRELADVYHKENDVAASIGSGTYPVEGMVIVPASMKTVAAVAHGFGDNLISRSADVTLKERRRLVVVPRETPFHLGHLRNLVALAEMGATVLPPIVAFYHQPKTVMDIVHHTVGRILEQFSISHDLYAPWQGPTEPGNE
ncbi:MAG: UbiX family flavin prenyltransferase [Vulcanimicrobiota bacterium]